MSITGQGERGSIELFNDFLGAEIPVANAVAYGTSAGGCNYYLGDFKVLGDLAETDCGVVSLDKASGYARITGTDEDGYGCALGTGVSFSPALNGDMILEVRCEMQALTARNVFIGFAGTIADQVAEPATAATTTITKVVPCVGFLFDSQLTYGTYWHMPYILASDTTQTSTDVQSSQVAVAGESDILKIILHRDGSADWYINDVLEQSVGAGLAATTTTLLGVLVGTWGTTTTVSDLDVDYILFKANRDWTR